MKEGAYKIAINPKYGRYQRELASMIHKVFDKKIGSEPKASVNEEQTQVLHKPVVTKFKRRKVYARFKDNLWTTI